VSLDRLLAACTAGSLVWPWPWLAVQLLSNNRDRSYPRYRAGGSVISTLLTMAVLPEALKKWEGGRAPRGTGLPIMEHGVSRPENF